MASAHLLPLVVVLSGLRWTAAVAGLQIYYYRQPLPMNPNPIQSWKVEGLATRIVQNAFSDNLDCNTTSNNGSGIGWTGQVGFNPYWVQLLANGKRLVLDSFTNANFGIYTCHDSATNESLKVNITSANPAIQAVSDVVTIEAGSSGQLKVYASGIPDPASTNITWFKVGPGGNTTELKEPTVNFSSDHRTLLLSNVQESNGGTYRCIISQLSPYSSANVYIQLAITTKNVRTMVIQKPPNNISQQASSNATLTCIFSGSPNITWIRTNMKPLPPQANVITRYNGTTMATESVLHIPFIKPSDGGHYQCVAATADMVVSAAVDVIVQGPDFNNTTMTPSSNPGGMMNEAPLMQVVIAFVSVVIGTFLIALCLSVVTIVVCRLKIHKTKRHNLSEPRVRLQSITSGPQIGDIELHDDVFSAGTSIIPPRSLPKGSRAQRPSGSTSSTASLLGTRPPSTVGGHLPTIKEDALPNSRPSEGPTYAHPMSSEGPRYAHPMQEQTNPSVPHYMLIAPRDPNPVPLHHHACSFNPLGAQYADLTPVVLPSVLNITGSASQSSQPELDHPGPTIGASPRPWYENSNSSLRQVGIRDDIQPYATTSNLSIPLDPMVERTWDPPPSSTLPGSQVPLPYMDPAPLRHSLERSSRHRSLSPVMSSGDLV